MNEEIKNELETYYKANVWEQMTLGEALTLWSQKYGDAKALTEDGESITYKTLESEANKLAQGFKQYGFSKGDVVVLQMPNSIAFVEVSFALFKLGVIPVMALPAQRKVELKGIIEKTKAKGYIIKDQYLGFDYKMMAREILGELELPLEVIVMGEADEFIALETFKGEEELREKVEVDYTSVGLYLLSGGTTGIPKLIPRRHTDYLYVARESGKKCGMNGETVYLAALPMAHNFPLCCPGILGTFTVGGRVVICNVTSPDEIIPLIEDEEVTVTALVPAVAGMCIEFLEEDDSYDLSSLEVVQVGGSVLESYLAEKIEETFECTLQQVFGIAEGLICCTDLNASDEVRYTTQGSPISTYDEVLIVDEDEQEVPVGEAGELIVRGPYTIYGYYNLEEVNKVCISEKCYFKTGDKARKLENGNYQIMGRIKETINRAGEKITPSEIEELLLRHDDIESIQVIGVQDKLLGERICAFILGDEEVLSLNDIRNYLIGKQVATFKLPDQVVYVSQWPLTSVGKINRNSLKALAQTTGEEA